MRLEVGLFATVKSFAAKIDNISNCVLISKKNSTHTHFTSETYNLTLSAATENVKCEIIETRWKD